MIRAVGRWLTNWRNLASVAAVALVSLLAIVVISAVIGQHDALSTAQSAIASEREQRQAAKARVTLLLREIDVLQRSTRRNGAQIARLEEQVAVLRRQLQANGIQPVAGGSSPRPSLSPSPSRTASPRPYPTRSPSQSPTPKPSPSPSCVEVNPLGHAIHIC